MRNLAMKMLGATAGILFAGAGSAVAYPTLAQARAAGGAANQVLASVAAHGSPAGVVAPTAPARPSYVVVAGRLAGAADHAAAAAGRTLRSGASTVEHLASDIGGDLSALG